MLGLKNQNTKKINTGSNNYSSFFSSKPFHADKINEKPLNMNSAKKVFSCSKCGYNFSLNSDNFSEIICPWCGKILAK
jgi:rubrerythrin